MDANPRADPSLLAGEPARAGMLHALMDGRALTGCELAHAARITPQTAGGHLARMAAAGLVRVEKQGRHRYYRLASPALAQMLESSMQFAPDLKSMRPAPATGPRAAAMRAARTCYGHLAGRLGVALADGLVAGGHIELTHDAAVLTGSGVALMRRIGIDLGSLVARGRDARMLCRPCLDWSERRPHLAGAIGTALCAHGFRQEWIRRVAESRTVAITPAGRRSFRTLFGARLDA